MNDLAFTRGRGSSARLADVAGALVVATNGALDRLEAAGVPRPRGRVFSDFHANPTLDQALAAAHAREEYGARLVVGVGGGSALDMAKAARALPGDPVEADQVLDGRRAPRADASLLLVPTTAGTGSEVTQFATLYRKRRKVSLDADGVRADIALVDPALTDSCPPELTWTCAFDALAHTVESLWSTRSTAESRNYAEAALSLISPVLHDSRPTPSSLDRDRLSQGATLAGHAIDITRTTAAHAFAYPLTIHFGVPHGLACALNLTWLATAVEQATSHEIVGEPEAMTRAVNVLRRALCTDERDLGAAIRDLIAARGLAVRWPTTDASDLIDLVLAEGAASNRISGTPVAFDSTRVRAALQALLTDHGARKEQSDA